MLELIQRYPTIVRSDSDAYRSSAYGEWQEDGMWHGYLVFAAIEGDRVMVSPQETTQSSWQAIVHWAGTISAVYLEGALQRALARLPEAQLSRFLDEVTRIERHARARAQTLASAAELARSEAMVAGLTREETQRELAAIRATGTAIQRRSGFGKRKG